MVREAFWNNYTPGCCEHYLLHRMRDCPAFVPELDVVAVDAGKIVGNTVCVRGIILGDDGKRYGVLTLGPIAVLPEYQRKGVGSAMLDWIRKEAARMGFSAILLCGDPDYYERHGFLPAETKGIRTSDDLYAAALQVCELYDRALDGAAGRYLEDEVYSVEEAAVQQFDTQFPPKEKREGTPAQERFHQIASMRRKAFPDETEK